jgi:hypothetical protein|tara:strand:+ start:3986 stop:4669 length:684 start_codon:yes stop_codon:yes gene_type:complete
MNIEKFRKFLDELEMQTSRDEAGKIVVEEGFKYSKNFWNYYNEKQFCIQHMDLDDVETVCDIGAGVGLLGVLLNQWYNIEVEATDVTATFDAGIFQQMFAKMRIARHLLEIKNKEPIVLPKHYDMITITRSVFDREELPGGYKNKYPDELFDYEYFLDDIFKHCNKLFWKTNWQSWATQKVFPESVQPFLWWPQKNRSSKDGARSNAMSKPYRAWYIILTKEEWEKR